MTSNEAYLDFKIFNYSMFKYYFLIRQKISFIVQSKGCRIDYIIF